MAILITGGAGFIGSHLVEKLLAQDEQIVVIDNFHEFYNEDIKIKNVLESVGKVERYKEIIAEKEKDKKINRLIEIVNCENYFLYYADIRDEKKLETIFNNHNIEVVINLAALAGVRPSLLNPLEYEKVNIIGYLNLLEECKKRGIKKFLQASSSSVYGNNKKVPFKEDDVVDFAISPYAATKKSGEIHGHVYFKLYGIDSLQLRFFTVFGPRQRPDLAIHKFVDKISKGEPIDFYGDGNTFRDYTYVGDTVDGIIKGIEYLRKNSNVYEILNLGKTNTVSLKEMVETIEEVLDKKAILNRMPMQPGDVDKTYADITKAKNLIGYDPKTSFKDGIIKFVNWYMGGK